MWGHSECIIGANKGEKAEGWELWTGPIKDKKITGKFAIIGKGGGDKKPSRWASHEYI